MIKWYYKILILIALSVVFYLLSGSGATALLLFVLLVYFEFFLNSKPKDLKSSNNYEIT